MTEKQELEYDLMTDALRLLKQKKYERVKKIIDKLLFEYNKGEPIVSDETYDTILERYLKAVGENKRPLKENEEETWKTVTYTGIKPNRYEISSIGNIRDNETKIHLKKYLYDSDPYYSVNIPWQDLESNFKTSKFSIHRLVGWEFVPGWSIETNTIDHKNTNTTDNYYKNLEWVTNSENMRRAHQSGLVEKAYFQLGENNINSNLTTVDVGYICELLIKFKGKVQDVYNELIKQGKIHISQQNIHRIKHGHDWKEISDLYFNKNDFPRVGNKFFEEDIRKICECLVKNKGSVSMSLSELKNNIRNITRENIKDIKSKKAWKDISNEYFEDSFTVEKIRNLTENDIITEDELGVLIREYSNGTPLISDELYDILLEHYLKNNPNKTRPYLRNKQSVAINDIVGTLPKTYGIIEPFREGQKCYKDWIKGTKSFRIIAQPKFDGISIAYDPNSKRWFTRGDYDNGESVDVTNLFNDREIPDTWMFEYGCVSVKFEAIMSLETFNKLKLCRKNGELYVDPRSAVSGIISSRNLELMKFIDLIELRRIVDMNKVSSDKNGYCHLISDQLICFNEPCDATDYDSIQKFIDKLLEDGATITLTDMANGNSKTYNVDGVVVSELIRAHHRNSIINPSEEIAIKILNDVKETKIIDIEYQFGVAGRITPVAKVEPIEFEGRTISSITLSTLDRVSSLELRYHDTVRITYNIVPYLLSTKHDGTTPIPIPTTCPHCGSPFDLSTLKQVKCRNRDCVGMRLGSIIRYCQKMGMFGIDRGNITKLYEAGVITVIPSLYELTVEKICTVPGFKETSARNIIDAIWKQTKDVELHKWLGAWPMDDVGSRTWKSFLEQCQTQWSYDKRSFMDTLIEAFHSSSNLLCLWIGAIFHEDMTKVTFFGLGEITKMKIINGIKNNAEEMIKVFPFIKFKTLNKSRGKLCISGTRNKVLIDRLQQQGWEVVYNLTKDCSVLLTTDVDSRKAKKALDWNITVIPISKDGNFETFELSNF